MATTLVAKGSVDCSDGRVDVELLVDASNVAPDGVDADVVLSGDLFVEQTIGQPLDHAHFSLRKWDVSGGAGLLVFEGGWKSFQVVDQEAGD